MTGKYVHACDETCELNCEMKNTSYGSEWICFTCDSYLRRNKMPPQSVANKMNLSEIPIELKQLNSLENQLVSQIVPFMKIVSLVRGKQHGIHGPAICVPANLAKVQKICPRRDCDADLIKVKLKRKLQYKSHYNYQKIKLSHVKNAFLYLKQNNKYYHDIDLDQNWVDSFSDELIEDEAVDTNRESNSQNEPLCDNETETDDQTIDTTHTNLNDSAIDTDMNEDDPNIDTNK